MPRLYRNNPFTTEIKCIHEIFKARAANSGNCPGCGEKITELLYKPMKDKKKYKCAECQSIARVLPGTIFERSNIPLDEWFFALQSSFDQPLGVRAKRLAKSLNRPENTASYILLKIREWMGQQNPTALSALHIECDEAFVPTGTSGMGKGSVSGSGNKDRNSIVFAMVERGTTKERKKARVYAVHVTERDEPTLCKIVDDVAPDGATIYTDGWKPYRGIVKNGRSHRSVIHPSGAKKAGSFVDGPASTNKCEGFFSFVKAMWLYYRIIPELYIPSYIDQMVFKYNHSNDEDKMMETFLQSLPALKAVKRDFCNPKNREQW